MNGTKWYKLNKSNEPLVVFLDEKFRALELTVYSKIKSGIISVGEIVFGAELAFALSGKIDPLAFVWKHIPILVQDQFLYLRVILSNTTIFLGTIALCQLMVWFICKVKNIFFSDNKGTPANAYKLKQLFYKLVLNDIVTGISLEKIAGELVKERGLNSIGVQDKNLYIIYLEESVFYFHEALNTILDNKIIEINNTTREQYTEFLQMMDASVVKSIFEMCVSTLDRIIAGLRNNGLSITDAKDAQNKYTEYIGYIDDQLKDNSAPKNSKSNTNKCEKVQNMKRGILEDNANEAWSKAIVDCDDICSGKITLGYRKSFVAHLHNAVELFVKQYMLNINDHRVSTVKNGNAADGSPAKEFYNSEDLNSYFLGLDTDTRKKFYSIEFNQLVEISKKLFNTYFETNPQDKQLYCDGLKRIKDLRNDETHFYIEKESFLSEDDFKVLYNFMIAFYRILMYHKLLPYFGEASGEFKGLGFDRRLMQDFSYKKCIEKSQFLRELREEVNGIEFPWMGDSPYDIAQSICVIHKRYRDSLEFQKLLVYVEGMQRYNLLTVNEIPIEEADNNENIVGWNTFCEYIVVIPTQGN